VLPTTNAFMRLSPADRTRRGAENDLKRRGSLRPKGPTHGGVTGHTDRMLARRLAGVALACVLAAPAGACDPALSLVGQPCHPAEEDDPSFLGFTPEEVRFEATPADLATPNLVVCVAYHFRGRTTCPFGQNARGNALPSVDGANGGPFPTGVGPCKTLEGARVTGNRDADRVDGALVHPQCTDRPPSKSVFWTCQCAGADGKAIDGDCACPSDTTCVDLFNPTGVPEGPSAFFCVPRGDVFDPFTSCSTACDPASASCP